jgi:hypothetical protein
MKVKKKRQSSRKKSGPKKKEWNHSGFTEFSVKDAILAVYIIQFIQSKRALRFHSIPCTVLAVRH